MAREFENLKILINVINQEALSSIDRVIDKINELHARAFPEVTIDVNVRDGELDKLKAELAALQDEDVDVRSTTAGQASDAQKTAAGQRAEMIRRLNTINNNLRINNAQNNKMILAMSGGGVGSKIDKDTLNPQDIADVMMDAVLRTSMGGDAARRGRPDEIFERQSIFNIKQRDINNALAKFLPLFTAFKLSLPAAIAGIVGLATAAAGAALALGSIAALAALGMASERAGGGAPDMETFQEIFGEVMDMFFDAFLPLAQRLAPLAEDALDGLGMVLQDIATALHPILAMRGSARDFARFARRLIPSLIGDLLTAFRVVEPVFRDMASVLGDASIIEFFVRAFAEVEPQFRRLARTAMAVGPELIQLSRGFLDMASRIFQLLGVLIQVGAVFGLTTRHAGRTVAVFGALFTAFAILNALMTFRLIPAIVGMSASLWKNIGSMLAWIGVSGKYTFAAWVQTAATWKLVAATIGLITALSILTAGLLALVGGLTTAAASTAMATDNLAEFNDEMGRVEGQNAADRRPAFAASQSSVNRASGGGTTVNTTINTTEDDKDVDTAVNNLAWRVSK